MRMIYFVRHGETDFNVEKRIQGHSDSTLTETGIEQVETLQEALAHIEWRKIFSSPSKRAYETAKILAPGKAIFKDDRLKELYMGPFQGMRWSELKEKHPTLYEHYWFDPGKFKHESCETFDELKRRTEDFLQELVEDGPDGNILVVTHGVVIQKVLAIIKGLPLENFWETPLVKSASVTKVKIVGQTVELVAVGEQMTVHRF